jgi:hypothetical protein
MESAGIKGAKPYTYTNKQAADSQPDGDTNGAGSFRANRFISQAAWICLSLI